MTSEVGDLDLGRFRSYLQLVARRLLDQRLRGKVDSSDIVQETLMQAHQARAQFNGKTDAEMLAWLRQILARKVLNTLRDFKRDVRDIDREQPLNDAIDQSTTRAGEFLAAEQSSPSQAVQKHEQLLHLAEALVQLPDTQREALVLQMWDGWSVKQISEKMGKSPVAVAGLLKRGLEQLRQLLKAGEQSDESR